MNLAQKQALKQGVDCLSLLGIVAAFGMVIALYAALVYAPTERVMGSVQRIFYFHVSAAWVGFFAFFVAFAASIAYLTRRERAPDIWATASLEIGVLFATIILVSGSLWARPIWNTWWTWDPRLTATLVMWIYYVGVLLVRSLVDDADARARYAAVLNIVGFVNVPLVFMAIRWWRTIHPVLFTSEGMQLETRMLWALIVSLVAFTLLYAALLVYRVRLQRLADRVAQLRREISATLE